MGARRLTMLHSKSVGRLIGHFILYTADVRRHGKLRAGSWGDKNTLKC